MIIDITESVMSTLSDFKDQCHISDSVNECLLPKSIQTEATASRTFKTLSVAKIYFTKDTLIKLVLK